MYFKIVVSYPYIIFDGICQFFANN